MARRLVGLAAAGAVMVFAAACDEAPPSAPQDGPALARAPSPYACSFTGNPSLSNAINSYFTVLSERRAASDSASAIQAAFTGADPYANARERGFNFLNYFSQVAHSSSAGSFNAGALVVQQTIQCMFDVAAATGVGKDFFGWPSAEQFDFATALNFAQGGAFHVRGGNDDAPGPAIGNLAPSGPATAAGNLSVLSPGGLSWSAILQNTSRVLIYGNPVDGGYDWKLIPRNTGFSPGATVALCQGLGATYEDDAMINQSGVGVLGYTDAETLCGTFPVVAHAGFRGMLLHRLVRLGSLLAPRPLHATAAASSTIGGSASGAKGDVFTTLSVPAVELTFTSPNWKPTAKVNTSIGTVTVKVQTPATTPPTVQSPVGGIKVKMSTVNNNGVGTDVGQIIDGQCVAPAPPKTTLSTVGVGGLPGVTAVSWNDVCITKTGAVAIVATSEAEGRTGGAGSVSSPRFNVKP